MMAMTARKDTQREILGSTLHLVAEHGFHGTSVQMVADRADVGVGSLYRYFNSKDELIHAVFDEIGEKLELAILEGCSADLQFRERFDRLSLNMISYLASNPREFMFMEQYFASPYGISKGKEMLIGGSIGAKDSAGIFMSLFAEGKTARIIDDLPLVTLYALTVGAFLFLVNGHVSGFIDLDELTINKTIERSWGAISGRQPIENS